MRLVLGGTVIILKYTQNSTPELEIVNVKKRTSMNASHHIIPYTAWQTHPNNYSNAPTCSSLTRSALSSQVQLHFSMAAPMDVDTDVVCEVNVLVADVPGENGTLLLKVGDIKCGVSALEVAEELSRRTDLPVGCFRLRMGGRVLYDSSAIVADCGQHDAYVSLQWSKALPGGKGGFGANLRGSKGSRSKGDVGACRDLSGRRIRDVEKEKVRKELAKRPRTESIQENEEVDVGENKSEDVERNEGEMDVEEVRVRMIEMEQSVVDDVRAGLGIRKKARKRRRVSVEGELQTETRVV